MTALRRPALALRFRRFALRAFALPLLALLAAACAAGAFDTPESGSRGSRAVAGPATAGRDVTVAAPGTREVGHPLGPSRVPVDPRRLWVADARTDLDGLLALGVPPVGVWGAGAARPVPAHLEALAGDVVVTGDADTIDGAAIDVAAIERLAPDLLVGPVEALTGQAESLADVAPLFSHELPPARWRFHFRLLADLVGEPLRANQVIADYEDRAEGLGDELGRPRDTVVSLVGVDGDGELSALGPASFSGSVLDDVGLGRPPGQKVGEETAVTLDQAAGTDADLLVLVPTGGRLPEDEEFQGLARLLERFAGHSPGSRALVVGEHWTSGGILAANEVLDDLFDALVGPLPPAPAEGAPGGGVPRVR